ncbi:MAG TPA: GGDEF domain-containing protein, partial [Psychromonas hadalis]|nr:GGDEF domain-containing protein [Psychromonas hadalis]
MIKNNPRSSVLKILTKAITFFYVIFFSYAAFAINIERDEIPTALLPAFEQRFINPTTCIKSTTDYLDTAPRARLEKNISAPSINNLMQERQRIAATHLLGYCLIQDEQIEQALTLLMPLLKEKPLSLENIRTFSLIAMNIQERKRENLSDVTLYKIAKKTILKIQTEPDLIPPKLRTSFFFIYTHLALKTNHFEEASLALDKIKKQLTQQKNKQQSAYFHRQFDYYKGIYYALINQQQLALSSLLNADKIAKKESDISLRIQIKLRISELYKSKRSFSRAIHFSKEAVDLAMKTQNSAIQADSLLTLASLTHLNNDPNQALIYLFNGLELVEKSGNKDLIAHFLLELGKTYSALDSIDKKKLYTTKGKKKNNPNIRNSNLDLARKYLQSSRLYFREKKQTALQLESLLLLAQLNLRNNEPALAILQLEKVQALSLNKYPLLRMRAFEMLALSYEIAGDPNRAIFHFKNFHSLQNKIKQHQFRLQQLQINEHLRLYEETQNQQELQNKNQHLSVENHFFQEQSVILKGLAGIMFIALIFMFLRNKKLLQREQKATKKLSQHGRSQLITQYAPTALFNSSYKGEPLYYGLVYVPFLSQLNISRGYLRGANLEYRLGLALNKYLADETITYHIRDNQILFVSEQNRHRSSE